MPLGAFVSSTENMNAFTDNPVLGHITTFGGHPVCCAAGLAAMNYLMKDNLIGGVIAKSLLFKKLLRHSLIKGVRAQGLIIAIEFESFEINKKVIDKCIENGVFTDWFLFAPHCMRIAPPLIIGDDDIHTSCKVILTCCDAFI